EIVLARAAFRTGPVRRHVLPACARRYAFLRRAGLLVVDPAADQAHVLFHRAAAEPVLHGGIECEIVAIRVVPPARAARFPCPASAPPPRPSCSRSPPPIRRAARACGP